MVKDSGSVFLNIFSFMWKMWLRRHNWDKMIDQYLLHIRKDFIVVRTVQKWNELLREICVSVRVQALSAGTWHWPRFLLSESFLPVFESFLQSVFIQDGWWLSLDSCQKWWQLSRLYTMWELGLVKFKFRNQLNDFYFINIWIIWCLRFYTNVSYTYQKEIAAMLLLSLSPQPLLRHSYLLLLIF